ncbi:CBS domain-containing protein [Pseudonocardia benzenivorans]|jgi:CBS domain-containing protein|uniref:CBS domain containing protein n=2 Tax=Pseudonocardia TaxID=1847 RepID=F4CWJ7_PSEUX|nr:CBS domain-containing protein [Pseudonocardia dioxanivorans]AEA28689.1 CBS domain containing protein [Pseudonocardia dioxanivorans CB1190]GJF04063.1 signal transduction protein [Pseudonocardia sp. D17]
MRISDVLRNKGSAVATIGADASVGDVIAVLTTGNYGALPVMDGARLAGIVSERDVVRKLHELGPDLVRTPVADIMTADVVTCSPGDSALELSRVMTERRIRHLPVIADGELVGIVSIGDMVKARIDSLEVEREQLQSYIAS